MQDQSAQAAIANPPAPSHAPRRSSRGMIAVALLAFLLGGVAVGWFMSRGYLGGVMPQGQAAKLTGTAATASVGNGIAGTDLAAQARQGQAVLTVEARLAMLEDRLSRLNLQANAASGNAARAEGLLIAFAARRMVDRGEPLHYLADQLSLRFDNAQPRAVRTIVAFAEHPVTIDELAARLEALAPQLTGQSPDESLWDRASRDISSLFTIRREPSELISSEARIERARVMLRAGRIEESVEQVRSLPGADVATTWSVDALRYAEVQHSLDLIETTAMLGPNRPRSARVRQPVPAATPSPSPSPKN